MAAEPRGGELPTSRTHTRVLGESAVGWVGLLVAGVVLLVIAFRIWLTTRIPTPWIMVDELIYSELAKGLADGGHIAVREQPTTLNSIGYPLLVSPAWLFGAPGTAYGVAKALNVILMTTVTVPVFLWARRLASTPLALAAAGVVLLMPSFLYTGTIMTENAFFPAFVLACFALGLALEQPTLGRQAFALGAIGLACLIRTQAVIFVLIVPTALALKLALDLRASPSSGRTLVRELRRQAAWVVAPALAVVAYAGLTAIRGRSLSSTLGAYQAVGEANYSFGEAAHWVPQHFAELVVSAGFFPVVALAVLLALALWRGAASEAERVFLAVAFAATVWMVLEVAVFASRFSFRIEERNLFPVVALLVIALALWLERGLPRPLGLALPIAVATAALVPVLELPRLLNTSILSDTFAFIPLLRLSQKLSGGIPTVETLTNVAAFAAALAVLVIPRRVAAPILLGSIAVYFMLGSYSVFGSVRDFSRAVDATAYPADRDWVDDRLPPGEESAYLFGVGDAGQLATVLWQTELWNREVGRVLDLADEPGALPAARASIDRVTGRITAAPPVTPPPHYLLAPKTVDVEGGVVSRRGSLTLYRVDDPLRLRSTTDGLYADDWMGSDAVFTLYSTHSRSGSVTVSVSRAVWGGPDKPGRVRIEIGPQISGPGGAPAFSRVTARRTWVVHSRQQRLFTLPAPHPPFRVAVHVEPTFSPADYGSADTRQLGAQVRFFFVPS